LPQHLLIFHYKTDECQRFLVIDLLKVLISKNQPDFY